MKKLLDQQLKKFRDKIYGKDDALFDRNGNNVSRQVENELTNFYHETRKAQRDEIIEKIEKSITRGMVYDGERSKQIIDIIKTLK